MENENIDRLLKDTSTIVQEYQKKQLKSGNNLNIFEILNLDHDEVKITAFLYELLNINGSHGQGDFFVKSFIRDCLKIDFIKDAEFKHIHATKEKATKNNRRIDLCLESQSFIFAIEAKIYAHDQYFQLSDYYDDIKRFNKNCKLFYLTLDGKKPSKQSLGKLLDNEYVCLSFKYDIIPWLDNCINFLSEKTNLSYSLNQFNSILKKLCNLNDGGINMKVKDLILSNKENFISALTIDENIDIAKTEIIKTFMATIKRKAKAAGLDYDDSYFERNDGQIENFYSKPSVTWPALSIKYKDKSETGSNLEVFLRLEIEDNLFVGYCVTSNGRNNFERLNNDLERKIIAAHPDFKTGSEKNWWICWKHILINNDTINFRNFNENAISLIDENVLDDITNIVITELKELIK